MAMHYKKGKDVPKKINDNTQDKVKEEQKQPEAGKRSMEKDSEPKNGN
ncbi:MAG: hypothetical protein HY203_00330 [Nitrospirae bacterium]|nr:hypothetical protein [Nitrospirota bacterium]